MAVNQIQVLDWQSKNDRALFFDYWFSHPEQTHWNPNVTYQCHLPFQVATPWIVRLRKAKDELPVDPNLLENYRVEILEAKPCGKGAFGEVSRVVATLTLQQSELAVKKEYRLPIEAPKRIGKTQGRVMAKHEYEMLLAADPTGIKEPVYEDSQLRPQDGDTYKKSRATFFMPFHSGLGLDKILTMDRPTLDTFLTVDQRYDYSIELCEAVIEQVIEKGLIHHDLKPAHFIKTEEHKFKIIDWGLATQGPYGKMGQGAKPFISPEGWGFWGLDAKITSAVDSFAVGQCLLYLWRYKSAKADFEEWFEDLTPCLEYNKTPDQCPQRKITKIFDGITKLYNRSEIIGIIRKLIDNNPEKRISVEDALIQIRRLKMLERYKAQICQLRTLIELIQWDLGGLWGGKIIQLHAQLSKKIPTGPAQIWQDCYQLRINPNATLEDYLALEYKILSEGEQLADKFSFFRQSSTKTFYEVIKTCNTLGDLVLALETFPRDPVVAGNKVYNLPII